MSTRSMCGILFWIKVAFAIILSLAIAGFQSYLIYYSHNNAKTISQFINSAAEIQFPSSPLGIECNAEGIKARLEPADDQFLWGFSIQWDVDDAIKLTERLGKTAPIFNTFIKVDNNEHQVDILNWQAQQVQKLGGMLEVSVFPIIPLDDLTDLALYKLAAHMRRINSYYGVPVYLRFAQK